MYAAAASKRKAAALKIQAFFKFVLCKRQSLRLCAFLILANDSYNILARDHIHDGPSSARKASTTTAAAAAATRYEEKSSAINFNRSSRTSTDSAVKGEHHFTNLLTALALSTLYESALLEENFVRRLTYDTLDETDATFQGANEKSKALIRHQHPKMRHLYLFLPKEWFVEHVCDANVIEEERDRQREYFLDAREAGVSCHDTSAHYVYAYAYAQVRRCFGKENSAFLMEDYLPRWKRNAERWRCLQDAASRRNNKSYGEAKDAQAERFASFLFHLSAEMDALCRHDLHGRPCGGQPLKTYPTNNNTNLDFVDDVPPLGEYLNTDHTQQDSIAADFEKCGGNDKSHCGSRASSGERKEEEIVKTERPIALQEQTLDPDIRLAVDEGAKRKDADAMKAPGKKSVTFATEKDEREVVKEADDGISEEDDDDEFDESRLNRHYAEARKELYKSVFLQNAQRLSVSDEEKGKFYLRYVDPSAPVDDALSVSPNQPKPHEEAKTEEEVEEVGKGSVAEVQQPYLGSGRHGASLGRHSRDEGQQASGKEKRTAVCAVCELAGTLPPARTNETATADGEDDEDVLRQCHTCSAHVHTYCEYRCSIGAQESGDTAEGLVFCCLYCASVH